MRKIDADALMERFRKEQMAMDEHGREFSSCFCGYGNNLSTAWDCVEDIVDSMPTIEERKKGTYEFRKNEAGRIQVVCPFCGKVFFGGGSVLHVDGREENCTMGDTVRSWNGEKELHKKYCDECGAEMVEEGAAED